MRAPPQPPHPPQTSWRTLEAQHGTAIGAALGRSSLGEAARAARHDTGAVGVAFGPKRVQGRTTDEASVMFLVERKNAPQGAPVPPHIGGLATDVLEVGAVRRIDPAPGVRRDAFTERVRRPIPWGTGIGAIENGTLGALVSRVGDDAHRYVLSNNHVIANWGEARVGDRIFQPSSIPDEDEDWIAELTRWVPLVGLAHDPRAENRVDAAIARVRTPWRRHVSDRHARAEYAGRMWSWRKTADIPVGLPVMHVGATTGPERGEVIAYIDHLDIELGPPIGRARFVDQLVIAARGMGGDSGSLAFCPTDGSVVGLLFATSEVRALVTDGVAVDRAGPRDPVVIANPIEAVQRALSVRVASAVWRPPAGVSRAEYRRAAAAARALSTALSADDPPRVVVEGASNGVVLVVEAAHPLAGPRQFEGWRVRYRRR